MSADKVTLEEKYLQFFNKKNNSSKRIIRSYKIEQDTIYKLRLIINKIFEKTGESVDMTEIVNKGLDKYLTSLCQKLKINT